MRNIITKLTLLAVGISMLVFCFPGSLAWADSTTDAINNGVNAAAGPQAVGTTPEKTLNSTIANVVNILSVFVGVIAVIMIVVGGFRYVSSGGGEGVKKAKDTILYAIIGLVIVAMAQVIVRFVLNKATS